MEYKCRECLVSRIILVNLHLIFLNNIRARSPLIQKCIVMSMPGSVGKIHKYIQLKTHRYFMDINMFLNLFWHLEQKIYQNFFVTTKDTNNERLN